MKTTDLQPTATAGRVSFASRLSPLASRISLHTRGQIVRLFAGSIVFLSSLTACGGAADVLISFSTPPPGRDCPGDVYADSTPVLDGEWYALVWSPNTRFSGLTTSCQPVGEGERVLLVAPLARNGHCPYVVFEVDSKDAPVAGVYSVYMLDTRSADGKSVAGRTIDGKPNLLNAVAAKKTFAVTQAVSGGATGAQTSTRTEWTESYVEDAIAPRITAFKLEYGRVKISVVDLMPGVKYNVRMGSALNEMKNYALDIPHLSSENMAVFDLKESDCRFFRVVREPLVK